MVRFPVQLIINSFNLSKYCVTLKCCVGCRNILHCVGLSHPEHSLLSAISVP